MQIEQKKTGNTKRKAIKTFFVLLLISMIASILYGLRLAAFGAKGNEVEVLMIMWGVLIFIIGLLVAIPYLRGHPILSGDWRIILASAIIGIFPLMYLYTHLPISMLEYLAKPVKNPVINSLGHLKLIGGIDGFFLGTTVGLLTVSIDPKLTLSNRQGLWRYFLLTILITGILVGSMILNELGGFWDIAATFIPVLSMLLLKFGIGQWNKRHKKAILQQE